VGTLSLTLREEHTLRVFKKRLVRTMFGPMRDEIKGGRGRLLNEELHNLYSSPSIIRLIKSRRIRWERHVECMSEKRNAYRVLIGKSEEMILQRRLRYRWEDNTKIDF
jgi:hypothetical protein